MKTQIIKIDPKKLQLLKVNARFMRHETFARLTENVKKDKSLTSVPFCAIAGYYSESDEITRDGDGCIVYEVLSGNHRVKAAISAGLTEIEALVTDDPLTEDQRKAIQLSHNELVGEDDPATLKLLYMSIENIDMKMYSGLDDKTLALLDDVKPGSLCEANLDFQPITIVFLPEERELVEKIFDDVKKAVSGTKALYLARWGDYDRFMDGMEDVSRSYGIKNVATSLMLILDIFSRHMTDLQEGFLDHDGEVMKSHNGYVSLATILGDNLVSPAVASAIRKIISKVNGKGKKAQLDLIYKVLTEGSKLLNDQNI